MGEDVVFVWSDQPEIDRGWNPDDAANVAINLGFDVSTIFIKSRSELEALIKNEPNALIWPVCYTIGSDVRGPLLASVLEEIGAHFVGPGSAALSLSSKLEFKAALASRTPYRSPDYHIVNSGELPKARIGFPAVLKTEFSCNSEGVAVANGPLSFAEIYEKFSSTYSQTIFVERWERAREYTVGYLPPVLNQPEATAALEIRLSENAQYLDTNAKSDNSRLKLFLPEAEKAAELEKVTADIARRLVIDGHFRMDFVENVRGQLFPIEVNFLPFLTYSEPNRSYFPMAFELTGRLTYKQIIERLLSHAKNRPAV